MAAYSLPREGAASMQYLECVDYWRHIRCSLCNGCDNRTREDFSRFGLEDFHYGLFTVSRLHLHHRVCALVPACIHQVLRTFFTSRHAFHCNSIRNQNNPPSLSKLRYSQLRQTQPLSTALNADKQPERNVHQAQHHHVITTHLRHSHGHLAGDDSLHAALYEAQRGPLSCEVRSASPRVSADELREFHRSRQKVQLSTY